MDTRTNSNRFKRADAFSINLTNPNSDTADAVYCMENLKGDLICVLENSIAKVLSANTIDPANEHPDTRHSHQYIFQIGSGNRFIARTILQAKDILGSVVLNKEFDRQAILDHVWDCTQHLINCESSYYKIYSDTMKLMKKCDEIITRKKNTSHIPSLPQIENLDQHVGAFLGNGKRFLEKSHELLCIFYGCTCFSSDFPAYRSWMTKNKKDRTEIITFLKQEKDWIELLAWYRNALDINHSRAGFEVIVENFKLRAGNKFTGPCWKYDFSHRNDKVQDEPHDLIHGMDVFINNMLTFFEELFLLCVKDNWDVRYNYEIHKHNKESVNVKCPVLYYISSKRK